MKKLVLIGFVVILFAGCTSNQRARNWGGTQTIMIDRGKKVINCTWKDNDLWILTTDMDSINKPRILKLQEKSSFGILQGEVIMVESR